MTESLEFRIENSSSLNVQDSLNSPLHYGKFAFSDLKKGQGITFANSLRRVLLYDLEGQGITHVSVLIQDKLGKEFSEPSFRESNSNQIHEFSSIPGMRESILELLLNLRTVVFRSKTPSTPEGVEKFSSQSSEPQIFHFRFSECLKKQNSRKLKMNPPDRQLSNTESSFILYADHLENPLVVNSNQYLASFIPDQCPDFEIYYLVGPGVSGTPNSKPKIPDSLLISQVDENSLSKNLWLPTDGNFFPVKKVNYSVEERNLSVHHESRKAQLGSNHEFESVFVEIWTNGSLSPAQACDEALDTLVQIFQKARTSGA